VVVHLGVKPIATHTKPSIANATHTHRSTLTHAALPPPTPPNRRDGWSGIILELLASDKDAAKDVKSPYWQRVFAVHFSPTERVCMS